MKPLFIFSLPRSGSTLLQRLLATHPEVATASEPWLLLPYLYALKENGICAEYSHRTARIALEDFVSELPNGKNDYLHSLHDFVMHLYVKAAKQEATYFLDKTPRYHLIADEIVNLFPEGEFIFLWRNPLAIIASLMETFHQGKWNAHHFEVDLFSGLNNLIEVYERYGERMKVIRYEDLLIHPEIECAELFNSLGLMSDNTELSKFNKVALRGCMGDPTGVKQYSTLSTEPLEKWKLLLTNPLRKAWCRRYLKKIGENRLRVMGYDMRTLLDELDGIPTNSYLIGSDLLRMTYGFIRPLVDHKNVFKYS